MVSRVVFRSAKCYNWRVAAPARSGASRVPRSGSPTVQRLIITHRSNSGLKAESLLLNLIRVSFLILVILVLWGTGTVLRAHLTEQFVAV